MIFTLETLRARHGDCLLLHYGSRRRPRLALIDGGPSRVYGPNLKPRLKAIAKARGLARDAPLPIDLLMVSHVDDDHINGILGLTGELKRALDDRRPPSVRIAKAWHNSFDDILGNSPDDLKASITAQFGAATFGGRAPSVEGLDEDAAKVLASVGQGFRLREDFRRLRVARNAPFQELVIAKGRRGSISREGGGLKLRIIGPLRSELRALQKKHDKFLRDNDLARRAPEAALAAFSDRSVQNLASIVVLAESGRKRMLLTGDARGDRILDGLEGAGLMTPRGTLSVDVLKVPHHGSDRNVTSGFFRRIRAEHYVFSGDGRHGNPERATMEMLFEAKGARHVHLYLTYPVAEIDATRREEHEKHGGRWVASRHGLRSFFEAKRRAGVAFTVHELGDAETFKLELRTRLEP